MTSLVQSATRADAGCSLVEGVVGNMPRRAAVVSPDEAASLPRAVERVGRASWRNGHVVSDGERAIPEEVPVAFTYNGSSYAVMMATPRDLEDFAVGFSLTEQIVDEPGQIEELEVVRAALGIELRMWIDESRNEALRLRRRRLAGPTGCGLCGIESLAEAVRPLRTTTSEARVAVAAIDAALGNVAAYQHLNRQTHAMHAAALCRPGHAIMLREDIGRHNALDKLAGAIARSSLPAESGFLFLTSRISIEMVQKAAGIGVPVVIAVSAPTALAVRACDAAGLTLIAVARQDGFEIFTHPHRIIRDHATDG
jgi:FdhD protein